METDFKELTITVQAAQPLPVLTTITVTPETAIVVQGDPQAFTAATLDQYGNPIVGTITWSSSDVAVGTVDTAGVLTAVSAGTTTVSATSGTVSASAEITVTEAPAVPVLTTVTISPQAPSMIEGSTVQFIATTLDQYGAAIASTVSWNSMDENVGSIDANGLFTGNFAGTTTITVTATDGAVTLSNSAIATVTSMPPVSSAMVTFIVTNTKGKPVEDAKVSMNGITRETNDDGKVVFLNVVPGVYSYKVSRNGYTAVTGNVSATGITKVPVELVKTEKKHERQDRQEIHEIED